MAKRVEIVGVLVSAGDRRDPDVQYAVEAADSMTRIARIGNAAGKLSGDVQTALRLCEQKDAAVRCQPVPVEGGTDFLTMNGVKRERRKGIVCVGDRGRFYPV
jgi:hypothetical protein